MWVKMSGAKDFIYYTLLKKGKIIIAILGIIVFMMVFIYFQNWQLGFKEVTTNTVKTCSQNSECFYWCDECVSIASTEICKSEYRPCKCVNGICQEAAS